MQWIAPSVKNGTTDTLEERLWDSADQFRANSGLKAQEYSGPILGIVFLRFAEVRFSAHHVKLEKASSSSRRGSRADEPAAYHAEGILYLTPNARFDFLLNLPEGKNIGAKVNEAMRDIEKHNPQLDGVLPKTYNLFTSTLLKESPRGEKTAMVLAAIDRQVGTFCVADLQLECRGVGLDLIRRLLAQMRKKKKIRSLGTGRSAKWEKSLN